MKILVAFIFVFTFSQLQSQCIDSSIINPNGKLFECDPLNVFNIEPVCACDSFTFVNPLCALYSGARRITYNGGCQCIDSSIIDKNYSLDKNPYMMNPNLLCGCDGKTYIDPYEAYFKYGVTRFNVSGGCNCIDSSFINEATYNKLKILTVRKDEIKGCRYDESFAVCGCDSVTYRSNIEAVYKYGITKYRPGKCSCIDSSKIDNNYFCDTIYKPVCACNGITYHNACIAEKRYGIKEYKPGNCLCYDSVLFKPNFRCSNPFPKLKFVCGCDSITYINICQATCENNVLKILHDGVCRCPDYKIIKPNIFCHESYEPVCGCDGKTYKNICEAEDKRGIWALKRNGPCKCKDDNVIDSTIKCYPELLYDPVCGCDSITYPNECTALYTYGVTSWKSGPCNYKCQDNSIIDSSRFCSEVYKPVCGCDNITYKNECQAYYKYGVSKWRNGSCDSITSTSTYPSHALVIYPNPASANLIMECFEFPIQSYSVINLQGQVLLYEKSNESRVSIDVSLFSNGLYFISINIKDKYFNRKIIVKK